MYCSGTFGSDVYFSILVVVDWWRELETYMNKNDTGRSFKTTAFDKFVLHFASTTSGGKWLQFSAEV